MQGRAGNRYAGRRTSGALRKAQQRHLDVLLPHYRLSDQAWGSRQSLLQAFGSETDTLWLEIGFGAGEHLLSLAASATAERGTSVGVIGCDVFLNGIAATVRRLHESGSTCVRIVDNDAEWLLERVPPNTFHRIYALFPDPWPKARHEKRRLYASGRLEQMANSLVPGGILTFASDDYPYILGLKEAMEVCPQLTVTTVECDPPEDRLMHTRYAQKALDKGLSLHLIEAVRSVKVGANAAV